MFAPVADLTVCILANAEWARLVHQTRKINPRTAQAPVIFRDAGKIIRIEYTGLGNKYVNF